MKLFTFRLPPGTDLKHELEAFAAREKLDAAFIITCVGSLTAVSYTHLRAHETVLDLVCRLLLNKKKKKKLYSEFCQQYVTITYI